MAPLATVAVVDPPVCVAMEIAATPDPVRAIDCGLPAALSAIARESICGPAEAGVDVTTIVQLDVGAKVLPHCEFAVKGPVTVTELIATATGAALIRVMVFASEGTQTVSVPKSSVVEGS